MATLYYFPDQNAAGCPKERFTRRWSVFQEALAAILKMAIILLDSQGEVVSLQNSLSPAAWVFKRPGVAEAYRDYFRRIPRIHRELSRIETAVDPLGLPVALTRLDDGCYLLMGEVPECGDLEPFTVPGQQPAAETAALEYGRFLLSALKPEEIKERLSHTAGLFNKLHRYFARPNLPALLFVIESLEQLIAAFAPEYLDTGAILELLTSCLVLIAEGGSAFVFTYEYPGRIATVGCGERLEEVQALAEDWKRLGQVEDPGKAFAAMINDRVKRKSKTRLKGILNQNNGVSIYLGLIGAKGAYLQEALRAFVGKAAAALEVSSLWTGCQGSWKMVLNSIGQGVIVVDNRGSILIMNPAAKELCKERGISPAVGRPVQCCRLGSQIEEALLGAAGNSSSFKSRCSLIDENGSPVHLLWEVVPLLRDNGQNAGAILVFDDITVMVRLKEEIRKWERLATSGEIAASLAHEVRNPLATAKAAIQLLRMDETTLERGELLEKLDRELDRTNNILTNFLNISRPMQDEKLEPLFLGEILEELLFFLKGEAVLNEIDLVITVPPEGLPAVLGSANSIKQVCLNIALNAIEAMSGGGRLAISLFQRDERVQIRFEDNGPGIPAENIEALTRPFFTTKPGGTGLGLAISIAILESMGGDLKIESNPGEGTVVELSLPVFVD